VLLPGPDTRVVELRVHGILGTSPENLTDSVEAVEVAGDGLGRFFRPADRLRRPSSGPVLRAGGRPVPRVVEGYLWSGMTSGSWGKAMWALLFPFALVNVAHWMLPPTRAGRVARQLGTVLRALVRLAGMLLTVLLITQLTVVSLDLLAAQWFPSVLPSWLLRLPGARIGLGLLPVLVVIFLLHRVSTVNWRVADQDAPTVRSRSMAMPNMPGATYRLDPDTPSLRALHTLAALLSVALFTAGGPLKPAAAELSGLWTAALAALLVVVATVLVLANPTSGAPTGFARVVHYGLRPIPRNVLFLASLGLLGVIAAGRTLPVGALPESGSTLLVIAAALAGCIALITVLVLPAALLNRSDWRTQPRLLRPWAGGCAAVAPLALAALLGGGLGAGLAIGVQQILRGAHLVVPGAYWTVTLLWGVTATGAAALLGLSVLGALLWRAIRGFDPAELSVLHPDRPLDAALARKAWWWANLRRGHSHQVVLLFIAALTLGAGGAAAATLRYVVLPTWLDGVSGLGIAALTALVASLLRVTRSSQGRADAGRRLGLLAELTAFWPRQAHPIVAPSYGLKVVPELAARAEQLLAEPGTRVVLVGHDHGGLLATAAAARLLARLPEADRGRVGLVTVGSALQWAYPRAFPAVVSHDSLARLCGALDGRWRSVCRHTDPVGGAVSTWNRQVFEGKVLGIGFRPDGGAGPLAPGTVSETGALVLGGDHFLPDPMPGPYTGRRWNPGLLGHRDYLVDPEWDRAVAIAAGVEQADQLYTPAEDTNWIKIVTGSGTLFKSQAPVADQSRDEEIPPQADAG